MTDTAKCTNGDVRLVNGTSNRGIFQVCIGASWEMLCATNWDDNDAAVVCRQLSQNVSGELRAGYTVYSSH